MSDIGEHTTPTGGEPAWATPSRLALILAGLVVLVFGRCVTHDFLSWDDRDMVSRHAILNPPSWESVAKVWASPTIGLYTPLSYTLWSAVAVVARVEQPDEHGITLNPMTFHLLNVLLHAGCTVLVLLILRQLISRAVPAAVGAAVFAMHPMQVEPVAWIAGMNNLLAGLFVFGCIAAYLHGMNLPERKRWYAISLALLLLALLSKPTAIAAPAVIAAIDWLILRRPVRRIAIAVAPMVALVLPFVVIGRLAQPSIFTYVPPLWGKIVVATDAVGFYITKLVVPWPLVMEYGRSPRWLLSGGATATTFLALAAAGVAVVLGSRRGRTFVAGAALVFLLAVAPVLGLVPFEYQAYSTVADRYAYLAMLGVAILVAMLLARRPGRAGYAVALIVISAWAILSFIQAGRWRDTFSIGHHTLAHNPRSVAAHVTLAFSYREANDPPSAEYHNREALKIDPGSIFANVNLANLLKDQGRLPEAIKYYQQAYNEKCDYPSMYLSFTECLLATGQSRRAVNVLSDVLNARPNDASLRAALGFALLQDNRPDEARQEFEFVLRQNPNDPRAKLGLQALSQP